MQTNEIKLSIAKKIATITFNRPSTLNALTLQAILSLAKILKQCENSGDVSILVLRGEGEKAFSAGADIHLFDNFKDAQDAKEFWTKTGPEIHSYIEKMTKPVVSVVSGYCLGGGLEIALASDLVIATEDSKFGFPEVNLGLLPGWGGTQRIARVLGRLKAKQLVMLGEFIDANEAVQIGIVNWVVKRADLDSFLEKTLLKLTEKSPVVLKYAKKAVNKAYDSSIEEGLKYEAELDTALITTEDTRERIRAFLEKRKPVFKGK